MTIIFRLAFLFIWIFTTEVKSQNTGSENKDIYFASSTELLNYWDSISLKGEQFFTEIKPSQWQKEITHFREKAESEELVLQLNCVEGNVLFSQSKYREAIPILSSVLEHREKIQDVYLQRVLVQLEESYRRTGNLKDAIPLRKERIELGLDQDFFEIYEEAGLYQEAIVEYTQHNPFPKSPLSRLGHHARIGRLHNQNNQLDSAIYHYEKAFSYGYSTLDKEDYLGRNPAYDFRKKFWTYEMNGEIGLIYTKQQRYQEAIPLLRKIVEVGKEINELALIVPKRLGLVECYLKLNELTLAKQELDTVKRAIQEMDWFAHKVKYQQVLGEYFYKKGVFDSAAIAFKTHNLLKDSIQKAQNQNKLIATTAFLDNERQGKLLAEQRLELINAEKNSIQKSNQLNVLIFAILSSLGIIGFLFVDTRRKQKAKQKALKDKAIIEEQSKKLKELDQVKTKFFSNISHEFRTPLTLIQGPIESILLGKADSDQTIKKNLIVAQRNVIALRGLIDEILEFNKMEMGDLNLQDRSVLLSDYLDELCQGYHILAKEQKINFIESYQSLGDVRLELPIIQVERIIHNLMSNAIKHSAENTDVKLEVTYQNDILTFSVIDNGPGIKKTDLEKVFDRFYQTNYGKSLPHSTGLGLSYVKEISEILNGEISVSSEEGHGATFTFSMEAKRSEDTGLVETKEAEDITELVAKYSSPNNKILVVEDNQELAEYIVQVLGDQFVIEIAEDGQVALDVMNDFNPDLIISDIMMPVMDGMELLSRLKAHETWKYKSIMMLTAKSGHEVKLEALSLGLDDYLTKPFSSKELEIRVRNILQNQHNRSQWLLQNNERQSEAEDPLINELVIEIEKNIEDKRFGVLNLSNFASLSDRQLSRVVKKSTGLTPANLIKEVKLSKAKYYLEMKTYRTVAEVSYAVGFEKPSYFSQVFFERYGKKPSHYFQ